MSTHKEAVSWDEYFFGRSTNLNPPKCECLGGVPGACFLYVFMIKKKSQPWGIWRELLKIIAYKQSKNVFLKQYRCAAHIGMGGVKIKKEPRQWDEYVYRIS